MRQRPPCRTCGRPYPPATPTEKLCTICGATFIRRDGEAAGGYRLRLTCGANECRQEQKARTQTAVPHRCSACGKTGHNRASCQHRNAWIEAGRSCGYCKDACGWGERTFWSKKVMKVLGFGHEACVQKWEAGGMRNAEIHSTP